MLPNERRVVLAGGEEASGPIGELECVHLEIVPAERGQPVHGLSGEAEHKDAMIAGAGGEEASAGAKRHTADLLVLGELDRRQVEVEQVGGVAAEEHVAVEAGGDQPARVPARAAAAAEGREAHERYAPHKIAHHLANLGGLQVPDDDGAVVAARGQHAIVVAHVQVSDLFPVAAQRTCQQAAPNAPDFDKPVIGALFFK